MQKGTNLEYIHYRSMLGIARPVEVLQLVVDVVVASMEVVVVAAVAEAAIAIAVVVAAAPAPVVGHDTPVVVGVVFCTARGD